MAWTLEDSVSQYNGTTEEVEFEKFIKNNSERMSTKYGNRCRNSFRLRIKLFGEKNYVKDVRKLESSKVKDRQNYLYFLMEFCNIINLLLLLEIMYCTIQHSIIHVCVGVFVLFLPPFLEGFKDSYFCVGKSGPELVLEVPVS